MVGGAVGSSPGRPDRINYLTSRLMRAIRSFTPLLNTVMDVYAVSYFSDDGHGSARPTLRFKRNARVKKMKKKSGNICPRRGSIGYLGERIFRRVLYYLRREV